MYRKPRLEEGIEQIEANGRDYEQIHGGDVRRVIAQEGAPSPAWRSTPLDHVLGNARLRDLKPEFEQFAVDTRRSPQWVLDAHLLDQRPQLRVNLWPERDFQRQYRRKPVRCQRTSASGRMTVMTFSTDANHRYSWIKTKRSPFVKRMRPLTFRRSADMRSLPQAGTST
ncbi:MAG: hypothetical protein WBW99_04135 [Pseudolabrys sp.]